MVPDENIPLSFISQMLISCKIVITSCDQLFLLFTEKCQLIIEIIDSYIYQVKKSCLGNFLELHFIHSKKVNIK